MTEARNEIIERTFRKEQSRLFNFIRKSVPAKEDAEDILQDVLYQFIAFFDEIEIIEKVSSWLFRTARNKIIDTYRKKKSIPFSKYTSSGKETDEDPVMLDEILPDMNGSPEDQYFHSLIWEEIEDALEELPEEQRGVFVMNEFDGMSFKEISKIMDEPVNTLLSRKRYAVLFLRKRLQNFYKEI